MYVNTLREELLCLPQLGYWSPHFSRALTGIIKDTFFQFNFPIDAGPA